MSGGGPRPPDTSGDPASTAGSGVPRLLLITPAAASAQTVTGVVRDESAAPVSGAAVLAFRADSLVGRAVTGGDGAYRITLARGGVLRIRFERLGYGTTEVAAQVDTASVTRVDATVSTAPLEVAGVVAEVRRACREPESPRALAELWLEARDILEALRSPPDPGRDSVPVRVTRCDLGPRGRIVHAEAVDTVWSRAGAPAGASVPMSDEGLRSVVDLRRRRPGGAAREGRRPPGRRALPARPGRPPSRAAARVDVDRPRPTHPLHPVVHPGRGAGGPYGVTVPTRDPVMIWRPSAGVRETPVPMPVPVTVWVVGTPDRSSQSVSKPGAPAKSGVSST